jgi:hypothetical protein
MFRRGFFQPEQDRAQEKTISFLSLRSNPLYRILFPQNFIGSCWRRLGTQAGLAAGIEMPRDWQGRAA